MTIFLWIVGGLVGLLLIPVWVRVKWEDQPTVYGGWLFLRIQLYPRPERPKPAKQPPGSQTAAPPPPKKSEKLSFEEVMGLVVDIAQSAKGGLQVLLRHLWVSRLSLQMAVGGADAAEVAIEFGRMNAYVYSVYGVLSSLIAMRRVQMDIRPDFLSEQTRVRLDLEVRLRPLFALGGLLGAGGSFLCRMLRRRGSTPASVPPKAGQGDE